MKCSNNHYVSGDFCGICGEVLREKKVPVKEIRKVSKKRSKEMAEYTVKKKKFLKENSFCAVYPSMVATDIHHKKGRIGSLFLDERFWLPVSRKGHYRIESDPAWAYKMGFSMLRLEKIDDEI